MRRQVAELLLQIRQLDLFRAGRVLEGVVSSLARCFPVPELNRVLRVARHPSRGDAEATGIRLIALCDPDLEIDIRLPESEKITFDAANDPAAKILGVADVLH